MDNQWEYETTINSTNKFISSWWGNILWFSPTCVLYPSIPRATQVLRRTFLRCRLIKFPPMEVVGRFFLFLAFRARICTHNEAPSLLKPSTKWYSYKKSNLIHSTQFHTLIWRVRGWVRWMWESCESWKFTLIHCVWPCSLCSQLGWYDFFSWEFPIHISTAWWWGDTRAQRRDGRERRKMMKWKISFL